MPHRVRCFHAVAVPRGQTESGALVKKKSLIPRYFPPLFEKAISVLEKMRPRPPLMQNRRRVLIFGRFVN
jgi:hypothetical protein